MVEGAFGSGGILAGVGSGSQVFLDGKRAEDAPPFQGLRDTEFDDIVTLR